MNPSSSAFWPTTLFRTVQPDEADEVRRLLGLGPDDEPMIFVLVGVDRPPSSPPPVGVAVDILDGTWLIRSAYGVEDSEVAARVGNDLLSEAVRSGAVSVVTPVDAGPACLAILGDGRGQRKGGWIVVEL